MPECSPLFGPILGMFGAQVWGPEPITACWLSKSYGSLGLVSLVVRWRCFPTLPTRGDSWVNQTK